MPTKFIAVLALIICTFAHSTPIAIVDTGFDLDNDFLKANLYKESDISQAQLKEFEGWSFQDNKHLADPAVAGSKLQEVLLYRSLKARAHQQGLTAEEASWMTRKQSEPDFKEALRAFKRHSHGTFVASIALGNGENVSIFPVRGLHIQVPTLLVETEKITDTPQTTAHQHSEASFIKEMEASANRVNRKFTKIVQYVAAHKIQIINASYGVTHKHVQALLRDKFQEITGLAIDETKLNEYVTRYFDLILNSATQTVQRYPRTLFIFSAGNSGQDNDLYYHYPSRIRLPNVISVAALNGEFLASFSNFGKVHVDVAAPGVGIPVQLPAVYSKETDMKISPASGTSMAAPFVANLAARVKDKNRKLNAEQIKYLLMSTGDHKPALTDKLVSGQAINSEMAIKAAELSREMSLEAAIQLATSKVIPLAQAETTTQVDPAQKLQESLPKIVPSETMVEEISPIEETPAPSITPTSETIPNPASEGETTK